MQSFPGAKRSVQSFSKTSERTLAIPRQMAALESMKELEVAAAEASKISMQDLAIAAEQLVKPEGLTLQQTEEGGKSAGPFKTKHPRRRTNGRSTPTSPSKAVARLLAWASLRGGSSKEAR